MKTQYHTLEGSNTWDGSRFYFADADHRKPFLFTHAKDYAHHFTTESDARATADMIVELSSKDAFLGYERLELVCHHAPVASKVFGLYDLNSYRAN